LPYAWTSSLLDLDMGLIFRKLQSYAYIFQFINAQERTEKVGQDNTVGIRGRGAICISKYTPGAGIRFNQSTNREQGGG
jgi:hypothetical protein